MVEEKEQQRETVSTVGNCNGLSQIIGALLMDLAKAQHISNKYSARLAEAYLHDEKLQPFTVPNAFINNFQLDVSFASNGVKDAHEPEFSMVHGAFRSILPDLVQGILDRLCTVLKPRLKKAKAHHQENGVKPKTITANLQKRFGSYLKTRLLQTFHENAPLLGSENHRRWLKNLSGQLTKTVVLEIAEHRDLEHLLDAGSRGEMEEKLREIIHMPVMNLKPVIELALEMSRDKSLLASIDTNLLRDLPVHALMNLKLMVDMRDYKWVFTEDENGRPMSGTDQLVRNT